jgi:hypothetical protein
MATMSRFERKKSARGGSGLPSPATGSLFSFRTRALSSGSRIFATLFFSGSWLIAL